MSRITAIASISALNIVMYGTAIAVINWALMVMNSSSLVIEGVISVLIIATFLMVTLILSDYLLEFSKTLDEEVPAE